MESESHAVYGFEPREAPSLLLEALGLSGCFGIRSESLEISPRLLCSDEARLKCVVSIEL